MKRNLLFYIASFLFSFGLLAQPAEFDFNSGCSTNFGRLYAQITLDGVPLDDGTWVAAVDPDGNIAGRVQAQTISGFAGLVILPIYEDSDQGAGCDQIDGGINCIVPGTCEEFGVMAYVENDSDPSMNCFAGTVGFMPYLKTTVGTPGGEPEIVGFESANVINGSATVIALSSTEPPCFTDFDDAFLFLPVELTAFTGVQQGKAVLLEWTTASESGNEGFDIERSADGRTFTNVGTVRGAGESSTEVNYSFVDENPSNGVNYYRLRQNDFDGGFDYSEVIQVALAGSNADFQVFPNPTQASFNLRLQGEWNEAVTITLLDQTGRILQTYKQQRGTLAELPLPSRLAAGIYQVRAEDGERATTTKLVVK